MKGKIIVLGIITAFCAVNLSAQNQNRDRLNAYKIAFFTKRLNLTPQEAEKFWPVYNEFQDKRISIQTERQEINRNFNQNGLNMSDREMTEAGDRLVDLEIQEANHAKEFHSQLKTILSPVKVLRLYQAENQFRQQLLNDLQNRREARPDPNIR